MRPDSIRLDKVYSLHGGAYLVGPRQILQSVDQASKQRSRDLDLARRQHRDLDRRISELDEPRHLGSHAQQAVLKALKRDKLRCEPLQRGLSSGVKH